MRRKKQNVGNAVLIAASSACFVAAGASCARADFVVSLTSSTPTVVGDDDVWVIQAVNNGATGTQNTGSELAGLDLTITTPSTGGSPTTGALVIQLTDLNGDGLPDANIIDAPPPDGSPRPTFGSAVGTFVGYSAIANSITASTTPGSVLVNGEAGSYLSGSGLIPDSPIDPAFTGGYVHSLEMIFNTPIDDATNHPIANIVVPQNTPFTANVRIAGDLGLPDSFAISVPEPGGNWVLALAGVFLLQRPRIRRKVT